MINFLKWILSQSQIFNFILLESEIIKNFSYTLKISSIIDVYSKFCRQIKSKIISNQKLPTRTSVNTTRQPFYFEDCRDRCSSEYHGFPFPFHNYKEIISSLDGSAESQKQARYDIDARKPIFYVDAVYDFEQSTWFTGYGLIKDFKLWSKILDSIFRFQVLHTTISLTNQNIDGLWPFQIQCGTVSFI